MGCRAAARGRRGRRAASGGLKRVQALERDALVLDLDLVCGDVASVDISWRVSADFPARLEGVRTAHSSPVGMAQGRV
jgi:hypothetical protein